MTVDSKDDNYMPHHIVVMGGDSDSLKEISEDSLRNLGEKKFNRI